MMALSLVLCVPYITAPWWPYTNWTLCYSPMMALYKLYLVLQPHDGFLLTTSCLTAPMMTVIWLCLMVKTPWWFCTNLLCVPALVVCTTSHPRGHTPRCVYTRNRGSLEQLVPVPVWPHDWRHAAPPIRRTHQDNVTWQLTKLDTLVYRVMCAAPKSYSFRAMSRLPLTHLVNMH